MNKVKRVFVGSDTISCGYTDAEIENRLNSTFRPKSIAIDKVLNDFSFANRLLIRMLVFTLPFRQVN